MSDSKHYKGIIKFFSYKKGYGFIVCKELNEDVFFHFSSISNEPKMIVYLIPNETVEFELARGPRGYLARNVISKNRAPDKLKMGKSNNIYYHYYYSFKKILDEMIKNLVEENKNN